LASFDQYWSDGVKPPVVCLASALSVIGFIFAQSVVLSVEWNPVFMVTLLQFAIPRLNALTTFL
jgi:hypothetical protein